MLKQSSGINYLLNKDIIMHKTILDVAIRKGLGVPKNYAEAVKWYKLSAEQGFAMAQNNIDVAMRKVLVSKRMKLKQLSGINYLLNKDVDYTKQSWMLL